MGDVAIFCFECSCCIYHYYRVIRLLLFQFSFNFHCPYVLCINTFGKLHSNCSSNVWASEQHIYAWMKEPIIIHRQCVAFNVYSYIFLFWIYFPFTIFYKNFSLFFFAFIFFIFWINFSINIVSFSLIMPIRLYFSIVHKLCTSISVIDGGWNLNNYNLLMFLTYLKKKVKRLE